MRENWALKAEGCTKLRDEHNAKYYPTLLVKDNMRTS